VLARLFDPSEDPYEPWRPCVRDMWCKVYGDRMPASIINAHAPALYSKADSPKAGFIINPNAVELMCAYHVDGSSMNKNCEPPGRTDQCTPGCPNGHADAEWCTSRWQTQCGWKPNQLDQCLLAQHDQGKAGVYNELILDGVSWQDNLPHTIEAVFWPHYANDGQRKHARDVHSKFLQRYGLTWQQVPLIEYDERTTPAFKLAP
jgi:hypothetical protein